MLASAGRIAVCLTLRMSYRSANNPDAWKAL